MLVTLHEFIITKFCSWLSDPSPEPNVILSRLTRCFAPSNCCKGSNHAREHNSNGQAHETEALCERSAQNCSCDEAHHTLHHAGHAHKNHSRKSRTSKGTSPPTPSAPVDQIFEAETSYISGSHQQGAGGNGSTRVLAQGGGGISGPAPHHPFMHECSYPRHRHAAHPPHRHGFSGGGHVTTPTSGRGHPQPLQLNTFGAMGDEPSNAWTKIDLAAVAGRGTPHPHETSPTPSAINSGLAAQRRSFDSMRVAAKYEKIDRVALLLFPIIFFLFNVCYWSYFLFLVEVLQDFW